MGKNRDRVSIVAAILEAAHPGSTKTRIMFHANLSFVLLQKYLEISLVSGLIKFENSKYHLTQRGFEFLKQYKFFEERYERAQRLLESLIDEREQLTKCCEKPNSLLPIQSMRTMDI